MRGFGRIYQGHFDFQSKRVREWTRDSIPTYAYYSPIILGDSLQDNQGFSANWMYLYPFIVHRTRKFDYIAAYKSASAAGTYYFRLGVYNDTGDVWPKEPILETADITMNIPSGLTDVALSPPLHLSAGRLYWAVMYAQNSTGIFRGMDYSKSGYSNHLLGADSIHTARANCIWYGVQAWNPFPNPFPAYAGAPYGPLWASSDFPLIMFRWYGP